MPSLSLVKAESDPVITGRDVRRVEETVWGLISLRKCLIEEGTDQEMVELVSQRLSQILGHYVSSYDWLSGSGGSTRKAASELMDKGYISSLRQVTNLIDQVNQGLEQEDSFPDLAGTIYVGVAGFFRAGKGAVGHVLQSEYRGLHSPFVDSLIAFAYALGYGENGSRADLREVNNIIKPRFGNDTFAKCTIDRARRQARKTRPTPWVLSFDGFRSREEAEAVLAIGGMMVGVSASIEVRYQRALRDTKKAGQIPKTLEEFLHDNEIEAAWIQQALDLASITFNNDQDNGIEGLRKQVTGYFDDYLTNPKI